MRKSVVASAILGLLLASCGGGGGGGESPPPSPTLYAVNGQVLASYVKGVFVCLPDGSVCVQTDDKGYFSIKVPEGTPYLALNLKGVNGGYETIGNFDYAPDRQVVVSPLTFVGGDTDAAAVLRTFVHALGGDTEGTALYLDLSKVEVVDFYDANGNPLAVPLAEALKKGEKVKAEVILPDGREAELSLDPTAGKVDLCTPDGCTSLRASTYNWLVLIYIMGDNNLSTLAVDTINQLSAAEYSPLIKVVALVDIWGAGGVTLYESTHDGSFVLSRRLPEADTANATYLYNFVKEQAATYPADRIALILWDHGMMWLGGEIESNSPRLAGTDVTSNSILYMYQLQNALMRLKNDGIKITLLGFDECLMSTVEVAYDVSVNADFVVASEYLEPGTGWNYTLLMNKLSSLPSVDGWSFAKLIVDAYRETYEGREDSSCVKGICTLAAYSTADALAVLDGLNAIADYYLKNYQTDDTLKDTYLTARNLAGVIDPDTEVAANSVDAYHFALNLKALLPVDGADLVVNTISQKFYSWSNDDRYKGISVYFPTSPADDNGWAETYYLCTPDDPCTLSSGLKYYNPFAQTLWAQFIQTFVNQ